MGAKRFKPTKQVSTFLLLACSLIFFDISNLDSVVFKWACSVIKFFGFKTSCPDYYDLPIWEVSVTMGTLSAAYYAYAGIREANKRLEIEQSPYLVIKDRIYTAGPTDRLHLISLKNIGKGRAINIKATADPEGLISIIDGTNPHSIDLNSGEPHLGWAIDEQRVVEGLLKQGKKVTCVANDIPDENALSEEQKVQADFYLYLWYEDQLGNGYKTETTFRHSGHFFKVMKNIVSKT